MAARRMAHAENCEFLTCNLWPCETLYPCALAQDEESWIFSCNDLGDFVQSSLKQTLAMGNKIRSGKVPNEAPPSQLHIGNTAAPGA